jgi:hypothetical protein
MLVQRGNTLSPVECKSSLSGLSSWHVALVNQTEPVCPHRFFFFLYHSQLSRGGSLIAELRLASSPIPGRGFYPPTSLRIPWELQEQETFAPLVLCSQ